MAQDYNIVQRMKNASFIKRKNIDIDFVTSCPLWFHFRFQLGVYVC